MYKMWQSPGGKVEKGETSEEAVLREIEEKIELKLKSSDFTYLFNDLACDYDVYMTKLSNSQLSQHLESEKQGP